LSRINLPHLAPELEKFWPENGPQWDALGLCECDNVLLVEAKAHISELFSSCKAGEASRIKIEAALDETAKYLGAEPRASWLSVFYQLTNRIAHLYFLRKHDVKAWLVLVNFLGDTEMNGPASEAEWKAAYQIVWHVLGIPARHNLSRYIIEIFPHIHDYLPTPEM
jgi:hypothetical protein